MTFPYEMPADQRSQFFAALRTLKVGDTYEQFRTTLGAPFKETTIRGKKSDDPVRGTRVTYYLNKVHATMVNEKKDEYVLLAFDNNKKLVSGVEEQAAPHWVAGDQLVGAVVLDADHLRFCKYARR